MGRQGRVALFGGEVRFGEMVFEEDFGEENLG